jgi:hypothetical protein
MKRKSQRVDELRRNDDEEEQGAREFLISKFDADAEKP